MSKAKSKLEQAYEDKIQKLEDLLVDKSNQIEMLLKDKHNLEAALSKMKLFEPASDLPKPVPSSISVIYANQAGEIFEKARQLVKLRNNPNVRIQLSKIGDKLEIEVRQDKPK